MGKLRDWYNRLNKKSALRRIELVLLSSVISAFGISCYYACGLGSDPISVFVEGQHILLGLSLGQITTINNVLLLILMLLTARRYFQVGTVITAFTTGPLIDLFYGMLARTFPVQTSTLLVKALLLAGGVLIFGLGLALYIAADFGIGAFDFPSLAVSDRLRVDLRWVRMAFDALFVAAGYLMGGIVGFGTIAGVILTGPVLSFLLKRMQKPLSCFMEPLYPDDAEKQT